MFLRNSLILAMTGLCLLSGQTHAESVSNEIALLRAEITRLSERLSVLEQQTQEGSPAVKTVVQQDDFVERKTSPEWIELAPYWHDGLHIVSKDKAFDISIGGRIHLDGAVMGADEGLRDYLSERDAGEIRNGMEVHRAQLHLKGTVYKDLYAKFEYNFSQGGYLGDCYLQWNQLPVVGHILVGKASRAFGLGATPSSNYQVFMESPSISVFSGGGLGVAIGKGILNQRMSWAAQLYGDTDSKNMTTKAEPNLNLRFTGLPWYVDHGRNLFHLGMSYKYGDENDGLQYHQRPDCNLAPYFVDTGKMKISRENVFGYDTALCYGPFSIEGEYDAAYITRKASDEQPNPEDLFFHGYYVTAACFLTGEYRGRQYMTGWGAFDSRVHPLENFSLSQGTWGAWQLAARYSELMLSDHDVEGGEMASFTTGLNWYWNSTTRIMLNYVRSHVNSAGTANIGEARLHFEF